MSTTMMPSNTTIGSPDRGAAALLMKRQESSPSSKATDETLSTANCDDSLTASTSAANMTQVRLYAPPTTEINVDRRNVRQRLRDQEAKINALLHKPSTAAASDGVLLKLIQTLEADLKKAQGEKQELQEALEKLQQELVENSKEQEDAKTEEEAEEDAVELAPPQLEETVMAERIAHLEVELRHKTHETYLLQDRWETTLRRMVQYQVDLETHDLHFTDYAAQQFQLGDEALKEIKGLTKKDQPEANRQVGKKAKHMMSTLLKDLEALGERYKEARTHQEQQVADLKIAQMEWQRRAEFLEAYCQEHGLNVQEERSKKTTMSGPLMKFHQKLRLQQTAAMQTHDELTAQLKASQQQSQGAQLECEVLQKEVDRLQQTVSQLQTATQQQQDALHKAQQAAADAAAAAAAPKAKRKGWFTKKKKTPPPPPPPPLPQIDVTAALVPMQNESKRFDLLHERLQSQSGALQKLQQDYQRVARQKSQLQQTVTDLRMEQEQDKAVAENDALQDLQVQMDELEAKRAQEQEQAQATIDDLRARLAALEGTQEVEVSSSEDYFA